MSSESLPQGTRIEEFELIKTLGRGGFGITYLAHDHGLKRKAVLKEYIPEGFATRTDSGQIQATSEESQRVLDWGLKRFSQEAQTLAQFRHPAIVSVQRLISNGDNSAFIVMDYLDGGNLEERVQKEGSLNWSQLRSLLAKLLSGCSAVHDLGILHRDIKPLNIMLVGGDPILIDFGAARQLEGQRKGSVSRIYADGYSPLEQYASDQPQDAFTDIYALAATAYFAIVGEDPPAAPARAAGQQLKSMREIGGAAFPEQLYKALEWGLEIQAADRPQSIKQWLEAFPELEEKQVVVEREVVTEVVTEVVNQGVDRRTLLLGGAVTGGLLLAAGGGYLLTRPPGKLEPMSSSVELSLARSKTLNRLADSSYAKMRAIGDTVFATAHKGTSLADAQMTMYRLGAELSADGPMFTASRKETMGFAIADLPDGDLIIGGASDFRLDSNGDPQTRMIVQRVTATGEDVWEKRFGKGNLTSLAVLESGIAFAGEDPSRGKIDTLTVIDADGSTVFDAIEIGKKSDESIEKLIAGDGDNFYSLIFRFRKDRTRTGSVVRLLGLVSGEIVEPWTYSDEAYLAEVGIDSSVPRDFARLGADVIFAGQIRESQKKRVDGGIRGTYITRIDGVTGKPIWAKHQLLKEEQDGEPAEISAIGLIEIEGEPCLLCGARMFNSGQAKILQLDGEGDIISEFDVPSESDSIVIRSFTSTSDGLFAIADEVDNSDMSLRIMLLEVD